MADGRATLGLLVAAKFVCCGGVVLVATGALSGLGIWLIDTWYMWVGTAGVVAVGFVLGKILKLVGRSVTVDHIVRRAQREPREDQ